MPALKPLLDSHISPLNQSIDGQQDNRTDHRQHEAHQEPRLTYVATVGGGTSIPEQATTDEAANHGTRNA
jgi:hypothetical protein